MPITVPDNPRVYTTKYDNFKGVDFTNDQTNIWRRRSPTGTNMLPDESGRPFKRNGWYVLLSNRDLCDALSVYSYEETEVDEETFDGNKTGYFTFDGADYIQCTEETVYDAEETYYTRSYGEVKIKKCAYFEIAGVDHIVVFTDSGVVFYNNENQVTAINTDSDCYEGYDRSFFFEGNGVSAFYIYGNFKVWRYEADFQLHDVTSQITVPTVLISASADCVGEFYNGYNMFGTKAAVEYNDCELYTWWCSDGISVDASRFKSQITKNAKGFWKWKRVSGSWTWDGSSGPSVEFPSSYIGISGTQRDGQEIAVVYCNGVLLPNNVSSETGVEVYLSAKAQFDYPLNVTYQTTPSKGTCTVFSDPVTREHKQAFVWISSLEKLTPIVAGEDYIKVVFPTLEVTTTQVTAQDSNASNATLAGV